MDTVDEECASSNTSQGIAGSITLPVDGIVWRELCREAERQCVDTQDLAAFALLYYLADADSGRIARRLPRSLDARATREGARELEA